MGNRDNHVGIFVETESDGSGRIYHVVGNILMGMNYEKKRAKQPDLSETFIVGSKKLIGQVGISKMDQFEAICQAIPPPGAQLKLNGEPIDPSIPIRRCAEWVEEVLEQLRKDNIMS